MKPQGVGMAKHLIGFCTAITLALLVPSSLKGQERAEMPDSFAEGQGAATSCTPTADGAAKRNQLAVYSGPCNLTEDRNLVDVGGNVGIGTSAPLKKLDVRADSILYSSNGSFSEGANVFFTGTQFFGGGLNLHAGPAGTPPSSSTLKGYFRLRGSQSGATNNIILGRYNGVDTIPLEVSYTNGDIYLAQDGGSVSIGTTSPVDIFTVVQGGGHAISDGWDVYSSRRWKSNIHTLQGALGKVQKLRGVEYTYTANGHHDVGMIAEEVGKVVPEVVSYEPDGKDARGIDYARLTALLVEAVKQQQTEIRELKSRVAQLSSSLSTH